MPEQDRNVHPTSRLMPALLVALVVAAGCIGGSSAIKGEIRDDGITLEKGHAGSNVRFELHDHDLTVCGAPGRPAGSHASRLVAASHSPRLSIGMS